MAIVTTNGKIVTGSSTNKLGTIGRSVFNSTIGTFTDKDTMNQIYSALNGLNLPIEAFEQQFNNESLNGRNKVESVLSLLASIDIKSSSDFMNKNQEFMKRLMRLNKQERDITLNALGVNVLDDSTVVKNDYLREYNHSKGNNYYEDYVKTLTYNQEIGDETTQLNLESNNHFNYSGIHNDLYSVRQNLYPDDDNVGTFSNKWVVENKNSLLSKMKKLYNANKVNTIISKFHTESSKQLNPFSESARSKYGLSHGRNLLKKKAEIGYNTSYANGYDNPYCRVWTHHHQYDRYYKTIRPFSEVDDQQNYVGTLSLSEFHNWAQFSDSLDTNPETSGNWGWKKEENNGWKNSVIGDNGLVKITPSYVNGGSSNIHTKDCMFSIENLAWRGYDPYSFEQALSWEQRGPMGGRIMWFPPYGIQFTETTTTDWMSNTFLGRGEDVYTYGKTTRSGTLSFMMVVDHPSILDYVTWSNSNSSVTDTDILRFLAGCGEGGGDSASRGENGNGIENANSIGGVGALNGLRDLAKPTPLTDEFTQVKDTINPNPAPPTIIEPQKLIDPLMPEDEKPLPKVLCFYVFYPNNYSGTYDDPYAAGGDGYRVDPSSKVEAIPYLLGGIGAQKSGGSYETAFANDLQLNEANGYAGAIGDGYEMGGNGLGRGGHFISGTSKYINTKGRNGRRYWTKLGTKGHPRSAKYTTGLKNPKNCKKWYYRIDGRYELPKDTMEEKMHYYNQTLTTPESYIDGTSFGLNHNISVLGSTMNDQIKLGEENNYYLIENNESEVYTLAEVAYVLYDGKSDLLKSKCRLTENERTKRLRNLLSKENVEFIKSISCEGYASAHGYVEVNKELARHRAYTAGSWFKHTLDEDIPAQFGLVRGGENPIGDKDVSDIDVKDQEWIRATNGGEDKLHAKKWRYARVLIEFDTVAKKNTSNLNHSENLSVEGNGKTKTTVAEENKQKLNAVTNRGGSSYIGFSPTGETVMYNGLQCDVYVQTNDKERKKWYLVGADEGGTPKFISAEYASEVTHTPKERYGGNKMDENRLRYDQEYHFFKVLKQTDPVVFGSLMDKLKYFDPAFHSMTPEGFNGRLTFLQQCMRQGNTVSASDGKFAKSANNLAFGRAPYCVLRLGDFYYQTIVIDNLSISYDPLVWDLNTEGIGAQPLIANIQISFKFVGGGDLTGPVRRLQNAMSFNYYANARLYDNRADRIERKWSDKTNGSIEHGEITENDIYNTSEEKKGVYNMNVGGSVGSTNTSSFYSTKMYK